MGLFRSSGQINYLIRATLNSYYVFHSYLKYVDWYLEIKNYNPNVQNIKE